MPQQFPRLLILGETFRNDTGGGITLINLLNNWPKEQIAVISDQSKYSSYAYKSSYYQLGEEEIRNKIFNRFIKSYGKSGIIRPSNNIIPPNSTKKYTKRPSFYTVSIKYCLTSLNIKCKISNRLLKFIKHFNPEILYIQPNSIIYVLLAKNLLKEYTFKRVAIHFMDDFKFYYNFKRSLFLRLFYEWHLSILRKIVDNTDRCFGISPKMCKEYSILFKKEFHSFHNPVRLSLWHEDQPILKKIESNKIRIVYSGRIGVANYNALNEIIDALEEFNPKTSTNYFLELYSPDKPKEIIEKIKQSKYISYEGFKSQEYIVERIKKSQIVLLPLSFDNEAIKRTYLSMPTKISEYLACSAAILVYAPSNTALVEYALSKQFGYVVQFKGIENIIKGFVALSDKDLRSAYSEVASKLAISTHSIDIVTVDFEEKLLK
ncbi:MAG: hypothetical protein ACFFC3_12980 [Candidatus Odinarchaeota archaeon]